MADAAQVTQDKPLLELEKINLTYESKTGNVNALEDINLRIHENEFVCVIGPSGCGKSSLLKLIAGFEKPSSGRILLEGEEIKGVDWHRGVVFQKDNLFEWLNVRSNIDYGLRMRGLGKAEIREKADEMLERMGLADFAESRVYELSGGMRQRVSIGRTLINDPEIILMDEPFSALDALTREEMQDFLRSLWDGSRKTIFFITHDIDEALVLGTRVVVMSKRPGRLISDMNVDYTREIVANNNSRVDLSQDYFKARRKLFELVAGLRGA
ncbi:MAG: ABC transporter ATP-binding protein [Lachnospiraceae bacterium]|nr:ABC transporter ATP-binding protein [Lachnospiraceae bacterium]